MAWTSPRTWVAGELVTATMGNAHWRDNLNALRDYLLGAQDLGANWLISTARQFRMSDTANVAHGMTTICPTDVYFQIGVGSASGGAFVRALSDADQYGLLFQGIIGTATPTVTTAAIQLSSYKKDGTGVQALGATETLLVVQNAGSDRVRIHGDGGINVIQGGLAVGYSATPGADVISCYDANFYLTSNGTVAALYLDSGDAIQFTRASNYYEFLIGAGAALKIEAGTVAFTPGAAATPSISTLGSSAEGIFFDTAAVGIAATNTEVIRFSSNSSISYWEMSETNAPSAPAANKVRVWCQDNGAGKTQLMALFSSGAAQQLAIQP